MWTYNSLKNVNILTTDIYLINLEHKFNLKFGKKVQITKTVRQKITHHK